MWKAISLLIKSGGTITLCTAVLFFLLTNATFSNAPAIQPKITNEVTSSPESLSGVQGPINPAHKDPAVSNTGNWTRNLPAIWHSHLSPVTPNPIDQAWRHSHELRK
ncbi:MAG: hypothetical protein LZF61_05555 [Nitrosomonas sp.]|nr:MAG: hypothetical protein LZF61_05555 [Nitrosomonas sp.]